jgi:hypothetical protein
MAAGVGTPRRVNRNPLWINTDALNKLQSLRGKKSLHENLASYRTFLVSRARYLVVASKNPSAELPAMFALLSVACLSRWRQAISCRSRRHTT